MNTQSVELAKHQDDLFDLDVRTLPTETTAEAPAMGKIATITECFSCSCS